MAQQAIGRGTPGNGAFEAANFLPSSGASEQPSIKAALFLIREHLLPFFLKTEITVHWRYRRLRLSAARKQTLPDGRN